MFEWITCFFSQRHADPVGHQWQPTDYLRRLINPLAGMAIRYIIGANGTGFGEVGVVTVAPYGEPPALYGLSIGYCNAFEEVFSGKLGPYIKGDDVAEEYDEGKVDPKSPNFAQNLRAQFQTRKNQGFLYVEIDNLTSFSLDVALRAIELAESFGLKVIAKNPGLYPHQQAVMYVARCHGIISESGAGTPTELNLIRREAGYPDMPVWFVANGSEGEKWCRQLVDGVRGRTNMGVSLSRGEKEYANSETVVFPVAA